MITTDELKETQPILYQILEKSFIHNTIPHAFLLVGYNTYDIAHYIAKALVCDESILACQNCIDCNKIENHNYSDLIFFSGKEKSIKKQNIEFIQEEFSKSSVEGKCQIYILENIDNSSSESMNSLLKTLEEPGNNKYAILTCNNLNKVLPTIQSRCRIVQLLPESKNTLKNNLIKQGMTNENAKIMSEIFQSYQDCEPYIESQLFDELKQEVKYFIEDMYLKKDNIIINVQTHLLKKYKDKNSITLFLNLLVLALKDLFHVKHSMNISYESFRNLYDKIITNDNNIISMIEIILETERNLSTNANINLLMDSMIYKIQKGVE
jgi:DNA polymerase-3 subunit delta'